MLFTVRIRKSDFNGLWSLGLGLDLEVMRLAAAGVSFGSVVRGENRRWARSQAGRKQHPVDINESQDSLAWGVVWFVWSVSPGGVSRLVVDYVKWRFRDFRCLSKAGTKFGRCMFSITVYH